jgi:hypothetical protein
MIQRSKPDKRQDSRGDPLSSLDCWQVDGTAEGALLGSHVAAQLLMSGEQADDLIDFGSVYVQGRQERSPTRRLTAGD